MESVVTLRVLIDLCSGLLGQKPCLSPDRQVCSVEAAQWTTERFPSRVEYRNCL